MTQENRHTPLPYNRNIKSNGKYPVIYSGRNQHVCTVSQQENGAETEANIDFIVRACNSHYELMEAFENLLNWHETKCPSHALKDVLIKDGWAALDKARGVT